MEKLDLTKMSVKEILDLYIKNNPVKMTQSEQDWFRMGFSDGVALLNAIGGLLYAKNMTEEEMNNIILTFLKDSEQEQLKLIEKLNKPKKKNLYYVNYRGGRA